MNKIHLIQVNQCVRLSSSIKLLLLRTLLLGCGNHVHAHRLVLLHLLLDQCGLVVHSHGAVVLGPLRAVVGLAGLWVDCRRSVFKIQIFCLTLYKIHILVPIPPAFTAFAMDIAGCPRLACIGCCICWWICCGACDTAVVIAPGTVW